MADGNPETSRRNRKNNNTEFTTDVLLKRIEEPSNGLWTGLLLDIVEQTFLRYLWLLIYFRLRAIVNEALILADKRSFFSHS